MYACHLRSACMLAYVSLSIQFCCLCVYMFACILAIHRMSAVSVSRLLCLFDFLFICTFRALVGSFRIVFRSFFFKSALTKKILA